jgi:hypothetical protein
MSNKWICQLLSLAILSISYNVYMCECQEPEALPPTAENCNGVFISYDFLDRRKGFPRVKNVTAQSWAFNATATILNTGKDVLKAWKLFIGFQHHEILVSANGGIPFEAGDFPSSVGNGTTLVGSSLPDLETSIDTANDLSQIQALIQIAGTQFGVRPPAIPMPKNIKLVNDGFKCPRPSVRSEYFSSSKHYYYHTILSYLPCRSLSIFFFFVFFFGSNSILARNSPVSK